jgi:hypothetical protein
LILNEYKVKNWADSVNNVAWKTKGKMERRDKILKKNAFHRNKRSETEIEKKRKRGAVSMENG